MSGWISTKQAAEYCGVHVNTILNAVWSGKLKGSQRVKPQGSWRFRAVDLDRWMLA